MLTRWKKHIVMLLLLVYTSQSIAALLMPCEMDASTAEVDAVVSAAMPMQHAMGHETQSSMHDHAAMGHSMTQGAMGMDAATDAAQPADAHDRSDCCDAMGHCLMGSCVVHGNSNDVVQVVEDSASKAVHSYLLKRTSHRTSIHFRPPISA